MIISRRAFMAATAGFTLAGLSKHVDAQGRRVLVATIPSTPTTLDPLNQSNHDAMAVSQLIYDNLLEVNASGDIVPQLAVALPDISDDKKTYTFRLRDDISFQNGAKFTSADVKYSYDYMLNPVNNALRRAYWEVIESVEVVSDYEVKLHLSKPHRPLLSLMTKYMGIFPSGSRETNAADVFASAPEGLGTGPAIFKRSQTGTFIELERNPNYWGPAPEWDVVRFEIASEANARIAGLMSGKTDVVGGPAARDYLRLSASGGAIKGDARPALGAAMLLMHNCGVAPFDDREFRLAVAMAFDRDAIAGRIYGGLMEPTAVLVPKSSPYHSADADAQLNFNQEAAKAHLAKSKYAQSPSFELMYPTDAYLLDVRDTSLYVQAALAEIGITVTLVPVETGKMFTELFKGNYKSALWAIVGPSDPTFLMTSLFMPGQALSAATNYKNPDFASLIEQSYAAEGTDLESILDQVQALLADDAPAAFIGTPSAFNLWGERVEDFDVNVGITLSLRTVKLAA